MQKEVKFPAQVIELVIWTRNVLIASQSPSSTWYTDSDSPSLKHKCWEATQADHMKLLGRRITTTGLHGSYLYCDSASGFQNGAGRPPPFIGSRRLFFMKGYHEMSLHQPSGYNMSQWARQQEAAWTPHTPQSRDRPAHLAGSGTPGAPGTPNQQVTPEPQKRASNIALRKHLQGIFFPLVVFWRWQWEKYHATSPKVRL